MYHDRRKKDGWEKRLTNAYEYTSKAALYILYGTPMLVLVLLLMEKPGSPGLEELVAANHLLYWSVSTEGKFCYFFGVILTAIGTTLSSVALRVDRASRKSVTIVKILVAASFLSLGLGLEVFRDYDRTLNPDLLRAYQLKNGVIIPAILILQTLLTTAQMDAVYAQQAHWWASKLKKIKEEPREQTEDISIDSSSSISASGRNRYEPFDPIADPVHQDAPLRTRAKSSRMN